jgi:hypothetical protein
MSTLASSNARARAATNPVARAAATTGTVQSKLTDPKPSDVRKS